MPTLEKIEITYETFDSSEKIETFANWGHNKYFNETQQALIRALNQRYANRAANEKHVKNGLEMFRMRNGKWFFAYCCEDGSYGFDYSDENLGVPSWMAWLPESVAFDENLPKTCYVTVDGDPTRLYPIPDFGIKEMLDNL